MLGVTLRLDPVPFRAGRCGRCIAGSRCRPLSAPPDCSKPGKALALQHDMIHLEQKAVVRACRNAIEFNSIPSVERIVPGGRNGLKLKIKIGTPHPDTVDLEAVKKVFPYGQTTFEVVDGGLCCNSGVAIPELGDKNDDMLIAVAAVTVGY